MSKPMIYKKAWDAISDEKCTEIWHQLREAINPGGRKTSEKILDQLNQDQKAALFNRLCCDYGKCVLLGGDSKRKEKLRLELERTLDLLHEMFSKPLRR